MATITFQKIFGRPNPLQNTSIDIQRPGIDGQVFKEIGTRARSVTLRVRSEHTDSAAAIAFIAATTALTGAEHTITNTLDAESFVVLFHNYSPDIPKLISTTTAGITYEVQGTIEVQATASGPV